MPRAKKDTPKDNETAVDTTDTLLQITSRRKDGSREFWLEDESKVSWEDCGVKKDEVPRHKAKDYVKKTKDGYELFFKTEVKEMKEGEE